MDGDGTIVFSGNEWIFDPDDLNNIDDDGNGFIDDFIGWDCSGYDGTDDNNPELPIQELTDNNFNWTHGTMVAGLLSAETDNSGGIASVSFGNDLISIKCSREEVGDNAVINDGFAGVTYAAKVGFYAGSFTIINCSWGSNIYSSYEQAVINIAHNQYGAVIVGASGNGDGFGNPLPEPFYPASYENVVSVTAVDENYSWCGWGNYHSSIDIAAPGVNIVSSILGENYSSASGTSFASPIVASCFGLLKSYYPDSSNLWLEQQILETADTTFLDNIDPEFDGLVGAGIIDIEAAIGHNLDNNYKLQITNYKLMECFPNPFNPKTTISYQLPTPSSVQLTVYNVNGQLVEQLVSSSSWQEAGNHRVGWDATNYPSGVYFVKLVAGGTSAGSIQGYTQTQKVMLLK